MIVDMPGEPDIIIQHSDRARYMRITVSPVSVRVAVPRGASLEAGRIFALERRQWIAEQVEKIRQRTMYHEKFTRHLPPITDEREASERIISRCKELSERTGLTCRRIAVRNQKTRWGSCSSSGTISLNIKLARLPQSLMDYVILHELVHTRVRGHGDDFWRELDVHVGDAKGMRRELKHYILSLL